MADQWTEIYDEGSGQYYFYNTVTGETSWENPNKSLIDSKSDSNPPALLPGWTQLFDEGSGTNYYYNEETGETRWDPPLAQEESKVSPPPGWTEVFDNDSQKTYYFNEQTGETSWEVPTDSSFNIAASVDHSTEKTEKVEGPKEEKSLENHAQDNSEWIEHIDSTSGRVYYEHSVTHVTQWDSPYSQTAAVPGISFLSLDPFRLSHLPPPRARAILRQQSESLQLCQPDPSKPSGERVGAPESVAVRLAQQEQALGLPLRARRLRGGVRQPGQEEELDEQPPRGQWLVAAERGPLIVLFVAAGGQGVRRVRLLPRGLAQGGGAHRRPALGEREQPAGGLGPAALPPGRDALVAARAALRLAQARGALLAAALRGALLPVRPARGHGGQLLRQRPREQQQPQQQRARDDHQGAGLAEQLDHLGHPGGPAATAAAAAAGRQPRLPHGRPDRRQQRAQQQQLGQPGADQPAGEADLAPERTAEELADRAEQPRAGGGGGEHVQADPALHGGQPPSRRQPRRLFLLRRLQSQQQSEPPRPPGASPHDLLELPRPQAAGQRQ